MIRPITITRITAVVLCAALFLIAELPWAQGASDMLRVLGGTVFGWLGLKQPNQEYTL